MQNASKTAKQAITAEMRDGFMENSFEEGISIS
jgi:hypothetical protein